MSHRPATLVQAFFLLPNGIPLAHYDSQQAEHMITYKRHLTPLAALSLSTLILAGCATQRKYILNQFQAEPIQNDASIQALETKYTNWVQFADWVRTNAPSEQKARRNEVLSDLIRLSDYKYEKFKTKLYVVDAGGNTLIDITSIGLTAAATLTGGTAGQVLAGTDTALKGAQGKVAERWLNAKAMRIIQTTMDSMRAEIYTTIATRMTSPYDQFPIEEGYQLVNRYHEAASLPNALARIATARATCPNAMKPSVMPISRGTSSSCGRPSRQRPSRTMRSCSMARRWVESSSIIA